MEKDKRGSFEIVSMEKKYYKVLKPEAFSPSTRFDYKKYLPRDGKAGPWLPEIPDAKIREEGYYVSEYWNFWYSPGDRIFEAEVEGIVEDSSSSPGAQKQVCCRKIRLLRELTGELSKDLSNCGEGNIGDFNTGRGNRGESNAGDFNIGSRNVGKLNVGDFNTGDSNCGIDNVGDSNKGSANTGSGNIGHSNGGFFNVGSYNTGSCNIGNKNSGSCNIGSSNAGSWNLGNGHSGFFNTLPEPIFMFNKPAGGISASDIILPKWLRLSCPLSKSSIRENFENADIGDIQSVLSLPNFDYEIFEQITGISRADFQRRLNCDRQASENLQI